jgi:glutamine synthetase
MTTAPAASGCPSPGPAGAPCENRVPGVDVNPYLAMAATLACGYLGMRDTAQAQ